MEDNTDNTSLKANSLTDFTDQVMGTTAELSQPNTLSYSLRFSTITQNRALLSNAYAQEGLIQTVVDQPVDDAFRGGLDISSTDFTTNDIDDLQHFMEEEATLQHVAQGVKWSRLYGGGGVIVNAGQNLDRPFDMEKITPRTPLELYPVDRWELAAPTSGNTLNQFLPMFRPGAPFNYYGVSMDQSHVMVMKGKEAPSFIRGHYLGWGMSEVERLIRATNLYLKHGNLVFELLDEAKVDAFAIEGFASALASPQGTAAVAQRVALANKMKNFQNALVMDSKDTWTQKTLSFSGLSEILEQIRIALASDCKMPLTKLFGITPSGLGNNDDVENYNSMIETEIRTKIRAHVRKILRICCRKVFGYTPKQLKFNFQPLRELTVAQQSEILTQRLNRIIATFQNGLITSEAAAEQINSEEIFKQPIRVNETLTLDEVHEIRGGKPAPTTPGYGAGTSVVTT